MTTKQLLLVSLIILVPILLFLKVKEVFSRTQSECVEGTVHKDGLINVVYLQNGDTIRVENITIEQLDSILNYR